MPTQRRENGGVKFKPREKVRVLVDAVGTVEHPAGVKAGAIGTVVKYYSGGVTPLVLVEFFSGFKGFFHEVHLERVDR